MISISNPISPWRYARRRASRYHFGVTSLVRADRPNDQDLDRLRAHVSERDAFLQERRAALERAHADVAAFKVRYRQEVGLLHEELDRLELELAEAELHILTGRVDQAAAAATEAPAAIRSEPEPRFTTDAVRKLFRDVAKAIHPDLAEDELARDRRHALMIEANRAYELGDEQQLRSILEAWERSPDAVRGTDTEAMRLRLVRRIDQIEEQLAMLAADQAALLESPMWKLKAMVDEEAARGKDLVKDMVRRLKRDILVATNRLDALRPPD